MAKEVRKLIRDMWQANPTWGSPRIVGELWKVGIKVTKSTVEKYWIRPPKPPSPTWETFLANHVDDLVALDFFVVPTVTYKVLLVLLILAHHERHLRQVLTGYFQYYHHWRTHRALDMDCPLQRPVQRPEAGLIREVPEVGGLHHHYERRAA
jgi:hypothetical protein